MSEQNPVIPLTGQEKKDTIDLSSLDINKRMNYNKKIERVMQEFVNINKPFCNNCAMKEYEKHKKKLQEEHIQQVQMGKQAQALEINPDFNPNFDQFSNSMKFINSTVIVKAPKYNPANPTTTHYDNYQCIKCGGGHSIEVTTPKGKKK